MKLKRIKFYFLALLAVTVFSCLKMGLSSKNESHSLQRASIISTFNHDAHEKIFQKEKIVCSNCHFMQFSLKNLKPKDNSKFSSELLYPGMEECHFCHNNKKYANLAPQKCIMCHKTMDLIVPDNHKIDWLQRHKNISRADKNECSNCHKDEYCSDCHLRKDSIRQRVHERNYVFSHSVVARANPRKCISCHTLEYCKECHTERGITQ